MKVVVHDNVDIDAIVASYLMTKIFDVEIITASNVKPDDEVIVVDMPADKVNARVVACYDHHSGEPYNSASEAVFEQTEVKEKYPHLRFLVELANACDSGRVLTLPSAIKLFHLSGYVVALKTAGRSDEEVIKELHEILRTYEKMLWQIHSAQNDAQDNISNAEIHEIKGVKVAIVRSASTHINNVLFTSGVDLIIFEDGNNMGVLRNASVSKPDLTDLKPIIEEKLRELKAEDEINEWFFHPKGFIAARGTRKYPAKTPSRLGVHDLLDAVKELLGGEGVED